MPSTDAADHIGQPADKTLHPRIVRNPCGFMRACIQPNIVPGLFGQNLAALSDAILLCHWISDLPNQRTRGD
jgi:hypothetical protein